MSVSGAAANKARTRTHAYLERRIVLACARKLREHFRVLRLADDRERARRRPRLHVGARLEQRRRRTAAAVHVLVPLLHRAEEPPVLGARQVGRERDALLLRLLEALLEEQRRAVRGRRKIALHVRAHDIQQAIEDGDDIVHVIIVIEETSLLRLVELGRNLRDGRLALAAQELQVLRDLRVVVVGHSWESGALGGGDGGRSTPNKCRRR